MNLALYFLIIKLCSPVIFVQEPLHFNMEDEWKKVAYQTDLLTFTHQDSLLEHHLELLFDAEKRPLLFYAYINTPVCIDQVCKPVDIYLYWNLLGNYIGFGIDEQTPLTKYDHEEFLPKDYARLHQLLQNPHSILERKTLDDLFDPQAKPEKKITFKGEEIDAVSGATKSEIKNSVVEGALYSCYTLWHLVHGSVKDSMSNYLSQIYSPELSRSFLHSTYPDYQLFALKQMGAQELIRDSAQILHIFYSAKPLIRTYILKKLPESLFQTTSFARPLYQSFAKLDMNTRTLLLKKLPLSSVETSEILSKDIGLMSRNQLKIYLDFFKSHPDLLTPEIRKEMKQVVDSQEYVFSYLIEAFLEDGE